MTKQEFSSRVMAMEKSLYYTAKSILKNAADSQDAVQSAVLMAYEKLHSLRRPEYFETWLMRILINECYKQTRSRRYHEDIETLCECSAAESATEMSELVMVIDSLDVKLRLPFVMFYSLGYSVKEISGILRITQSNVKTRLHRAREALKNRLGGSDYEV